MNLLLLACVNTSTLQLAEPVGAGEVRTVAGNGVAVLPDPTVGATNVVPVLAEFNFRYGVTDRFDFGVRASVLSPAFGAGVKFNLLDSDYVDLAVGPQILGSYRISSLPVVRWYLTDVPLLVGVQPVDRFRLESGVRLSRFDDRQNPALFVGWHAMPLIAVNGETTDYLGVSVDALHNLDGSLSRLEVTFIVVSSIF